MQQQRRLYVVDLRKKKRKRKEKTNVLGRRLDSFLIQPRLVSEITLTTLKAYDYLYPVSLNYESVVVQLLLLLPGASRVVSLVL